MELIGVGIRSIGVVSIVGCNRRSLGHPFCVCVGKKTKSSQHIDSVKIGRGTDVACHVRCHISMLTQSKADVDVTSAWTVITIFELKK